jgi:hypothetical protein
MQFPSDCHTRKNDLLEVATTLRSRGELAFATVALIAGGLLYINLRWRRSPRAYRAMFVLAGCYLIAGTFAGAWILTSPRQLRRRRAVRRVRPLCRRRHRSQRSLR